MNKPNFSVALIARNEALTLPRLIGSLKEFQERGGDIWVLDTGSTDNTIEVAQSLGCNVEAVGDKFRIRINEELAKKINDKFVVEGEAPVVTAGESLFDFASARNYIANFPTTDFIFTPDCDEIFTRFDIDKINECIENGVEQLEYNFVFSHDEQGNPVIKFMHCKAYDRRKLSWKGVIHEILVGDAKKQFLGEDTVYLEHYQNEKTNRSGYLKGLAIDCYNNPDNDRNSHYFAREMMYLGRFKSAIKEFLNHISMNRWPTEAAQSMLYIGDCYAHMGNTDEMIKWYGKSIEKENRREPYMRLAEHYFKKGMYSQCVAYCEAALSVTQLPFYSNHQPYYENVPHELLYISYWWLGDKFKSTLHYWSARKMKPNHPRYIADAKFYTNPVEPKISFILPTLGRPEGLKRCTDSIEALNYPKSNIEVIIKQDSYENRVGVPKLLKQGIEESTGEWIVFASNDTEFTPDSINEALAVGEKGYVAFNTGEVYEDGGNANEHFMIRKDIIEKIGEVFDTDFYHCGVDNLLMAKMKKMGIFVRADKAIVKHHHFAQGADMDKTYQLGWSHVEEDRELLKKKLAELI